VAPVVLVDRLRQNRTVEIEDGKADLSSLSEGEIDLVEEGYIDQLPEPGCRRIEV
jgi:hypothetical protein